MPDPASLPVGTGEPTLLEPKPRYRRQIDRYECPICGKTLGEKTFDHSGQPIVSIYVDDGPLSYHGVQIAARTRTFKPCGCQLSEGR